MHAIRILSFFLQLHFLVFESFFQISNIFIISIWPNHVTIIINIHGLLL